MGRETRQPSGSHDVKIARVAARQHGNITRAQLGAIGLSDDAIAHRARRGRLHRIHRGVFSVGRPAQTGLERASAAVLACGPTALLSHEAALVLWGFTSPWPSTFDVTVTAGNPRPKGITVHRSTQLARRDIRIQLGIRATSPARTILDCAPP
jgi:predicted transcriptional regulator of viral defense system